MKILVATNGSESSLKAENFAFDFFKGIPVRELVVVSVVRITGVLGSEEYKKLVEEQKVAYTAHQNDLEKRALAAGIKKVNGRRCLFMPAPFRSCARTWGTFPDTRAKLKISLGRNNPRP